jgi:thiamine biosynthesis lipoprotein
MGTTAHVVVEGAGRDLVADAVEQLATLEARWSRFRADSELSRLNASGGRPTVVHPHTTMLIERSVWSWLRTAGRFDPTVLDALESAGYTTAFDDLPDCSPAPSGRPAPGCDGIEVDRSLDMIRLPRGVRLDPGGIGKGLAADLVACALVDHGAAGALVSVGGDLRVAGRPPVGGWELEVDHHLAPPARLNLRVGALATSSVLRRRWATDAGVAHHVIDPRTGRPTDTTIVACSVVAGEAWWAEALATAVLVDGADSLSPDLASLLDQHAGALLTSADGSQRTVGALADSFSTTIDHPRRS